MKARSGALRSALLLLLLVSGCASGLRLDETKLIDLSHPFNEETVYWPTASRFELRPVAHGHTEAGYWYASNDFSASEHGGTHLDAPIHFASGGHSAAEVPLARLVAPARVIDIRARCAADRDYRLEPADVLEHEARFGAIRRGDAVLVLTGFGAYYPDLERYLGSAVRGVAEGLHFPGIGETAARLLVERGIDLVGIDTASLDHGPSRDFAAHRVFADAQVPGLENLAGLERLPPRGATIIALPMKIERGSGGPCRVIAVLP
jgi:kynurenine formamidase